MEHTIRRPQRQKNRWGIKASQIDWELFDEYGIIMKEELVMAA